MNVFVCVSADSTYRRWLSLYSTWPAVGSLRTVYTMEASSLSMSAARRSLALIGVVEPTVRKHKHSVSEREREMFYLTMHSTHFIYGYMASDIWLRTILIVRKETHCRHIGYSYRLTARVLLYASSHRKENT